MENSENGFHDTQIHFWFQGDSCLANIPMQQTFWLLGELIGSVIAFMLFNIAVSPKKLHIIKCYGKPVLKMTKIRVLNKTIVSHFNVSLE
jgi:uncharacterized membrane protein YraQ (UPF0718 family)